MNNVMYFEIQANDPQTLMDFYGDIFGWKFMKQDVPGTEYYSIQTEGISGGLLKRPAPVAEARSGTNAFVCSMQVENFDKCAELILSKGGIVALPKFAVPGKCYQGYFLDIDGNTFGIFEADPNAK